MRYCGIDLHSNNSVVVITDESDRVLFDRRLPNELAGVLAALEPHRSELAGVVVESTYNWYWLVDGLEAAGFPVVLANTVAIKQYDGLKHGDDTTDARHLAQLLRLGILPRAYIYPKAERGVRDLARKRMQLVRSRTQHILSVQNILARERAQTMSALVVEQLDAAAIKGLGVAPEVALALSSTVAVIQSLCQQIATVEKRLASCVRSRPQYALLTSVPGIGAILATVIVLETGAIERFASPGDYASYARCVRSLRLSNGRSKGSGNAKNGNPYLSWAFIEAAHFACRYCGEAKRFHDRKRARTNPVVAKKALAHKIARACYHMLSTGERFDVKRCFG
jgi:transposase